MCNIRSNFSNVPTAWSKRGYKDSQIPEKELRSSPVLQLVRFLVVASKTEKNEKKYVLQHQTIQWPSAH